MKRTLIDRIYRAVADAQEALDRGDIEGLELDELMDLESAAMALSDALVENLAPVAD